MLNKKSALIIVPHQDDELILAGPFWDKINDIYDLFILFITNGDYDLKTKINGRLIEAINSLKELETDESHIIFLGYGDKWINAHIYNAYSDEVKKSHCGRTETYGLPNHQDYHFNKFGRHALYTRENLLSDISNVIMDIMPDVILCNDIDNHPDHIATSLIVEEAIGNILKRNYGYYPLVLKKFNYLGSWFGKDDYWLYADTIIDKKHRFSKWGYELENPAFVVKDRKDIASSECQFKEDLSDSPLYAASKEYKSQPLYLRLHKVLNRNSIFWERRTDNLAIRAKISASSGNIDYLNDFKLLDCNNVNKGDAESFSELGWIPDRNDEKKEIVISLEKETSVKKIRIYELINRSSYIKDCIIQINGIEYHTGEFNKNSTCNEMIFNKAINNVSLIKIRINDFVGSQIGISEIEIFNTEESTKILFNENKDYVNYQKKHIYNTFKCLSADFQYFFKFKLYFGIRKVKNALQGRL